MDRRNTSPVKRGDGQAKHEPCKVAVMDRLDTSPKKEETRRSI
jgi:hypothetical protein